MMTAQRTRLANPRRAAAAAGEHSRRAAWGRGMLSDRTGLGPLAAMVADAFSARLRPPHGRIAARRLPRGAARNPRSPRLEVLPQSLRLLLGRRRTIRFAGGDGIPFARWGLAELQLMGWPLLAGDGRGWLFSLVAGNIARRAAGLGRLFLPRSAPPRPAGAGADGLAGRRHDCRR